jgi:hypothetical protein
MPKFTVWEDGYSADRSERFDQSAADVAEWYAQTIYDGAGPYKGASPGPYTICVMKGVRPGAEIIKFTVEVDYEVTFDAYRKG